VAYSIALHLLHKSLTFYTRKSRLPCCLLLMYMKDFGFWCQSIPKKIKYTLVSSKLMDIFVTLNAVLVAVWVVRGHYADLGTGG
jgi:hypothetical protein